MFLLVTGASGVGKSTVRRLLEPEFAGVLEMAELATLGVTPEWSIAWRHRMVERMVQRALEAQREGRHFLLCGDPVPPGEVCAAPSADRLEELAVCLLDASEAAQTRRLAGRGDEPEIIPRHVAFADWMRRHVTDPRYRPDVILRDAWPEMRWERWTGAGSVEPPWSSEVIDTSDRSPTEVSRRVAEWLRRRMA